MEIVAAISISAKIYLINVNLGKEHPLTTIHINATRTPLSEMLDTLLSEISIVEFENPCTIIYHSLEKDAKIDAFLQCLIFLADEKGEEWQPLSSTYFTMSKITAYFAADMFLKYCLEKLDNGQYHEKMLMSITAEQRNDLEKADFDEKLFVNLLKTLQTSLKHLI